MEINNFIVFYSHYSIYFLVALGIHQPWFNWSEMNIRGLPMATQNPMVSWFSNCAPSHCALWEPSAWSPVGSTLAEAGKITICNPKERGTGLHRKLFPWMWQWVKNIKLFNLQFVRNHRHLPKNIPITGSPLAFRFTVPTFPQSGAIAEVEREGVTRDIYAAILIYSVQLKYTNRYIYIYIL